jgi:hypothetical protein
LAEISGQLGGKIRPLRKKFGPLVIFTLFKAFVLETQKLSLSMSVAKV